MIARGIKYGKPANCNFIVCQKPKRYRASEIKDHSWQLTPDRLGKMFATVRKELNIGDDNPPTFHEIRSLSSHLLRKQGEEMADIAELMSHSDEDMTVLYTSGHPLPHKDMGLKINDFGGEF